MLTSDRVLADRYRIEAEVGRGGMARVYRATDTVLGRTVALKVLNEEFASDPTFVERFRREARAAARLNHPNVVSVFDTGSDGDVHFIVMELVEGLTLADVMVADGPLDPERAAGIARDVAAALSFAHAEGLVHRDVKPANVMITPSGQVKVMDFGIARLSTAHTITQASTVFGTAAYLAPEQAQGNRVDGRADVYALGVVLYEMLAGRVPFVADSALAVASKHVFEDPEPPSAVRPDIPPALEAVVVRAMQKDPDARYADAAQMAAALDAAVGAGPAADATLPIAAVAAQPRAVPPDRTAVLPTTPATRRHAAPPRRSRWWIPVIAAVVGLFLLAAFLPTLLGGDEPKGNAGPKHSGGNSPAPATTAPPTSTPPTTPATSAPPATTAPEQPTGPASVGDAITAVGTIVDNALAAGQIDDHLAKDVHHSLDEVGKRLDVGDVDKALEEIGTAEQKVAEAVDKGDASSEAGAAIIGSLGQLATTVQGSAATSSDEGNGDSSGPGPGHDKGHGHDDEKD